MESLDEVFWESLGVEAWKRASTGEEAVSAYLKVIPVIGRAYLRTMLPQASRSDIRSQMMKRGIAKLDRGYKSFSREALLWSKRHITRLKGNRVHLERTNGIYLRTGWNPVIAPLALKGLGNLMSRSSVILLGGDLLRWADTFCPPGADLPTEWSMEALGTGAGMLFIPSDDPEFPEEWVFYLEPGCFIVRNLMNLVEELAAMMSSRIHFGRRFKVSFLIGFDSYLTPVATRAKHRYLTCLYWARRFIRNSVPLAVEAGFSIGIYSVMCLREKPELWKYYYCPSPKELDWGEGLQPFRR